jgi:UDP-galactopyranose mutase
LVTEYPTSIGDPYYPIPTSENNTLYRKYQTLVDEEKNITFVGRLAQYKYFNMDQAVGSALDKSEKLLDYFNTRGL